MKLGFDWNKSAVARLEAMWAEGVSAAEIGYRLGCSKNSVISKARRCYCAERPSPIKRPAAKKVFTRYPRRVRKVRVTGPAEIVAPPPPATPRPQVVRLPGIHVGAAKSCQFPAWGDDEKPTHVYCGEPVERDESGAPTGSYCGACRSRCYTRTRRQERAA